VFLEDGNGFRQVLFDNLFDEFFMAVARLTVMSDTVFHTLTLRGFGGIGHREVSFGGFAVMLKISLSTSERLSWVKTQK
jgi:hypothetical protein